MDGRTRQTRGAEVVAYGKKAARVITTPPLAGCVTGRDRGGGAAREFGGAESAQGQGPADKDAQRGTKDALKDGRWQAKSGELDRGEI